MTDQQNTDSTAAKSQCCHDQPQTSWLRRLVCRILGCTKAAKPDNTETNNENPKGATQDDG